MTDAEKFDFINRRKNVNRGYRSLIVWQESIRMYGLVSKELQNNKKIARKTTDNISDAAHSVCRNIAEGYCRRSKAEYLRFLDFATASLAEVHSGYCAFFYAEQISAEEFEALDELHYKVENLLVKLVFSLQKYLPKNWENTFLNIKYLMEKSGEVND